MAKDFIPDEAKEALNEPHAATAKALAHWRRLYIVRVLAAHGPMKSTELYSEFDSPAETTKSHIRELKRAGIIAAVDEWDHEPRWMLVQDHVADLARLLADIVDTTDDSV